MLLNPKTDNDGLENTFRTGKKEEALPIHLTIVNRDPSDAETEEVLMRSMGKKKEENERMHFIH